MRYNRFNRRQVISGDIDHTVAAFPLPSERVTPDRWAVISRYMRVNSWRQRCGHDWDCCGCCYAQDMELKRVNGTPAIVVTQYFNV